MDVVTGEDRVIGIAAGLSLVAILGLVVVAVAVVVSVSRNRRAHAAMDPAQEALRERFGADLLRGLVSDRRSIAPASHRARWQLPAWLRTLAAHGARPEPSGYGPPPPLAVVEKPTVTAWSTRNRNVVPSLLNPAVGAAPVRRRDRWEALDVAQAVLRGDMQAAANAEDTGLIEPIRAEVVK